MNHSKKLSRKLKEKFYSSYENNNKKKQKNKLNNFLTINNYNIIELEESHFDVYKKNVISKGNFLDEEINADTNSKNLVDIQCLNCNLVKFLRNEILLFDNAKSLHNYLCKAFNNKILCIQEKKFLNNRNEFLEYGDEINDTIFQNTLILCKGCFLNLINKNNFMANIKNLFKKTNNNYFLNNNNSISTNINKISDNVGIEIPIDFPENDLNNNISINITNSPTKPIITDKPKSVEESPLKNGISFEITEENSFLSKKAFLNKFSNDNNKIYNKSSHNSINNITSNRKINISNSEIISANKELIFINNNDLQLDIKNNLFEMTKLLKLILLEAAFFVESLLNNIRCNFLNNNILNNQITEEMKFNSIYKMKFEISYKLFEQLINKYQFIIMKYDQIIFNIKNNLKKIIFENLEDKNKIESIKEEINNIENEFIGINNKYSEILNNFMRNFQILLGGLKRP